MAETTHPSQRTSGRSSTPSILETLNPFAPSTIVRSGEAIGKKSATAGEVAGQLVAGHKAEQVGEEIGHAPQALFEGAIGKLFGGAGTQIVEVLLGAALLLFGLYQIGKSSAGRLS